MSLEKSEFHGYLRNPNLLKDRVKQPYTAEEIKEYKKCMDDPVYFISNYIKVITPGKGLTAFEPYDCQKGLFNCLKDNRFTVLLASRQVGKSISVTSFILWYLIFHPEKTVAILANKGAIAREMLSRLTLALENLPYFLQPGCKIVNKGSIEFSNLSRVLAAATSASSIRGMSCVPGYTNIVLSVNGQTIETNINAALEKYSVEYGKHDSSIKILTERGYKNFKGFREMAKEKIIHRFYFSGGLFIDCTSNHRFLTNNGIYKKADQLNAGDVLYPEKLIKRKIIKEYTKSISVYDAINVEETSSYYTNGVISHNCDLIFCDEFAFVENDEEFYTSTYPVISASADSKFIITSTPNGVGNVFHKIWTGAVTKTNDFIPYKITWQDIPGRDEEWKRQTIANTSQSQFDQEHACVTGETLITVRNKIDKTIKTISIKELYHEL